MCEFDWWWGTDYCKAGIHFTETICLFENLKLILYFVTNCAFSSLIVFLNLGPSTRNYEWASWEAWSQCSITCGGQGTKIRNRACVPPSNGGFACPSSKETETATCEELKCPGREDQF